MIFFADKDKIYIAEIGHHASPVDRNFLLKMPENAPIFRAPGSRVLVAVTEAERFSGIDALRYIRVRFPKELSEAGLQKIVIPKYREALKRLRLLDGNGNPPFSVWFAKGNRLFTWDSSGLITEQVTPWSEESIQQYSLSEYDDLPPMKRIRAIYENREPIWGIDPYPIMVADTGKLKVEILHREDK